MTAAELTAAIEGPAKEVGGSVDPALIKRLLRDIGLDLSAGRDDQYDIGKLPLLEYALEQAWANARTAESASASMLGWNRRLRSGRTRSTTSYRRPAGRGQTFVRQSRHPWRRPEDTRARFTLPANPGMLAVADTFAGPGARLIVTGDDATGCASPRSATKP